MTRTTNTNTNTTTTTTTTYVGVKQGGCPKLRFVCGVPTVASQRAREAWLAERRSA